jgi:CBS domain containing-hemolysin-like protein
VSLIVSLGALGLILTCLAAIGADSLAEFSRAELEDICRRRNNLDRLGEVLRRYRAAGFAAETLQVLGTAVFIGTAGLWIWQVATPGEPLSGLLLGATFIVGFLALLAMEVWLPWAVARLWAAGFVYYTWPVWRGASLALYPLVCGGNLVNALMHRLAGRAREEPNGETIGEEIRTIVTEGHREGLLEEDAREMIEGVIELGDVEVSQIMTPRTDMVSLPLNRSWDEVIQFVIQAEHTRIPVYNKTRDDIVGILFTKDLLPELAKPAAERVQPWSTLLHEPYFVPENKPVDVLLQEFQATRHHMAIVLDEYGGVSGLVCLEDVLEEIVGEIADEYDEELVEGIRTLGDGQAEILGRVHIDEINERLGLHLPEDGDFDTIGGLVFSDLGHIPTPGEQVQFGDVRVSVVEATSRRVERVRLEWGVGVGR